MAAALKAVGMEAFTLHAPHHLSGGQKQRIAIAGVIAMEPACIVLDESTAMLDPLGRREVLDTVQKLNREKGIQTANDRISALPNTQGVQRHVKAVLPQSVEQLHSMGRGQRKRESLCPERNTKN